MSTDSFDATPPPARPSALPGQTPSKLVPDEIAGSGEQAADNKADVGAIRVEFRVRGIAGAVAGVLGVSVVVFVIWHSTSAINDELTRQFLLGPNFSQKSEKLIMVAMAVHGIISVAAVYFGYSMLRVAERMLIPRRLLTDFQDVEVIRAILGIRPPAKIALSQLKAMSAEVQSLVKTMAEFVKTLSKGADKPE
jgi:hypothetical protein